MLNLELLHWWARILVSMESDFLLSKLQYFINEPLPNGSKLFFSSPTDNQFLVRWFWYVDTDLDASNLVTFGLLYNLKRRENWWRRTSQWLFPNEIIEPNLVLVSTRGNQRHVNDNRFPKLSVQLSRTK